MKSFRIPVGPLMLATALVFATPHAFAQQIVGEVQVAPAIAKRMQQGGTLFVYVRAVGNDKGPPIAVLTIKQPQYPQRFTLRPEDQMVPGSAPRALDGRYKVYARHSVSGQPMAQEGFLGTTLGPDGKGARAGAEYKVVLDKAL
jgi:hypothetical protein